jgi:nitrilase
MNDSTAVTSAARVAAIQMVSTPMVAENLAAAGELVARAAGEGAHLIALPEYFCLLGRRDTDKVAAREALTDSGGGPIHDWLAATAARHGVWLVGGTLPVDCGSADKILSTCLVFDDRGRRVARYDKIHLFGFSKVHADGRVESFDESRTIVHGRNAPVALDTPFGRLGLSVCYDLRFPELYRALGACDLLLVPSAFTATTGRAHWESLLRARAIENLAYVLAPAQGGLHVNGRRTHGHSMFIDPWGEVLGVLPEGPGVVAGSLDRARIAAHRASLPALAHRTL